MNRREFGAGALVGLVVAGLRPAWALDVRGVTLGVQTYSFHNLKRGGQPAVDELLAILKRLDVKSCELFAPNLMPFPMPAWTWKLWEPGANPSPSEKERYEIYNAERTAPGYTKQLDDMRVWRVNTPASYFEGVAKQFHAAGVDIYCYNYSFSPEMTDAEIDAGFRHAKALGAKYITSSSTISMAQRVVPFAEKNGGYVGWHGHSDVKNPDAISTPDTFAKIMAMSKLYKINLDIGHFTAAGFDAVQFIDQQHANITNLHIKDRKKNDGDNRPLGEGDTPIKQVLLLLRDKGYKIPAFIEYEYVGKGRPEQEVASALAYEKKILES